MLGTPAYMAPEQARGETIDTRADVFALGGTLCAILTGRPPFVGKSSLEVIRLAVSGNLTDANARLDACRADPELVSLCRRCLSPAPADRPVDGQSVADGMTSYLNGVQERLQAAERERAVDLARAEEEARTRRAIEEKAAEQQKRRKVQRLLSGSVFGLVTAVGFGIALASLWQRAERSKVTAVAAQGEAETSRKAAEKAQVREAVATQLFSEALAKDSKLADDRERQLRYNAACVASLAAAEQGYDEPPTGDAEKSKLRHQALDWLKAELIAWARLLESDAPETRPAIVEILRHWQKDTDLVSIRDQAALARLPADEQEAFTRFWAVVEAMLQKAEKSPGPKEDK